MKQILLLNPLPRIRGLCQKSKGMVLSLLMLFTILFSSGIVKAQSGTVTFNTTDNQDMGAILHDGTYSNDISGIQLDIFSASTTANASSRTTDGTLVFQKSTSSGFTNDAFYANGTNPIYLVLYSSDGSEFSFQSFYIASFFGTGKLTVEGFKDGISTGSVPIDFSVTMDQTISSTDLPTAKFGDVDEIRISQSDGSASDLYYNNFTIAPAILPAPTVTGISPTSGPTTGGTSVTITGTNLSSATAVEFGTNNASITSNTATQIVATSPSGSTGSVHVTVTTAGGTSTTGGSDQFTYYTVPGAPTIGTATAGDGQASVTFTAPSSNGGSAISGYTVTSNPGGKTGTGTVSPISVPNLTNGTAYTFTVTATNAAGTSSASAASNSVIPKGAQTITFSNPGAQNFGTTPTLTASASSGLTPSFTSSTTGVCTITSGGTLSFITPGTCTINADQAGNSTYAAATTVSRSFSVNAVVAGAPTIGTATAGDGQASVIFTAPSSNGGSAITGYTVTSNPGNISAPGTESPITVSGLTNGTSYTFSVTATNGAGTSAASAASNSVIPGAATSSFTTTGNWSTAGNWSNGVPGTPTSVTISSGTCTLDADATVTNLTVSPGAAFTISSGKTLTVTGTLTLDANSSGIASLINNGTITATNTTVKSFLTKNVWHVVSSPAPTEKIGSFITDNKDYIQSTGSSPVYYGVMNYNEGTNSWNKGTSYFTEASITQFGAGYGYGVLPTAANDVTVSYKGTLASTTSNISVGLTNTGEGWNCIGNPYSSSLNINESTGTSFLNQNATSNLNDSYACVYIWDGASSSYKILGNSPVSSSSRYLTQSYIAPGQGFFVKAKGTGSPSVTFTPAMQSHQNSTALLKSARITWPAIRLNVVNNSDTTSTIVAFNNSMTKGLDPTYDAGLLRGTTGLNLYSRLVNDNGVDFAIQCLPEKYDSLVIPLGIECKKGGDITFNAETVELPASCNVILEDKATKTFTSLDNGGSYTATVNAGSAGTGRFYLHTSSLSTVTDVPSQNADNAVNACAKGKVIYITGSKLSGSDAKLYDISGRSINTYKLTSDGTVTLDESSLVNGVYVLHITSSGKAYAFKVILKD